MVDLPSPAPAIGRVNHTTQAPEGRLDVPPAASNHHFRWTLVLPLVWIALGARIAVALVRHESVRDDFLSLALVAFLMTSAVLGSRIWIWFQDHPAPRFRRESAAQS
jgi:hypothetical protein